MDPLRTGRNARLLGIGGALLLAWGMAAAHPNDSAAYGMRSLLRMGEEGLKALVLLEIPVDIVTGQFEQRYLKTGIVDPNNIGEAEVAEFYEWQWKRLAANLEILIDGKPPEGSWAPVQTPINGRANAGFFVYMVFFTPNESWPEFGSEVTVTIDNRLKFEDRAMFLSGYADGEGSWKVRENSAVAVLGDGASVEEANQNPDSWSLDQTLRKLHVVYVRDDEATDDEATDAEAGP